MAFDYCTAAEAFAYGGSAGTATDPVNEAAVMATVVTAVSRMIDQYCSQVFSIETYTDQVLRGVVDTDGVLTCYPAVPTMQQPTAAAYRIPASSIWHVLTPSNADVEDAPSGCTVRLFDTDLSAVRFSRLRVRLTYQGGYANAAALPHELAWCARALSWLTFQRRSAPMDATAMPELGVVINPGVWPADIRQTLNRYVKVVPA
jgi:hypothetical protein